MRTRKGKRKRGDHPREPCPTWLVVLLSTSTPLLWVIRPYFGFKSVAISDWSYTVFVKIFPLRFLFLNHYIWSGKFWYFGGLFGKKKKKKKRHLDNLNLNYPVFFLFKTMIKYEANLLWNDEIITFITFWQPFWKKAPSWLYPASWFLQAPWFQ